VKSIFYTILAFILLPLGSYSQTTSGYWCGSGFVPGAQGNQHNYLMELVLIGEGANVQGVLNYYYRNTYRSFPINGTFNTKKQELIITQVPLAYHGTGGDLRTDCIMSGSFSLIVARAGSSLTGRWKPVTTGTYNCPAIQTRLSLNKDLRVTDSLIRAIRAAKQKYEVWTAPKENNTEFARLQQSVYATKTSANPSPETDPAKQSVPAKSTPASTATDPTKRSNPNGSEATSSTKTTGSQIKESNTNNSNKQANRKDDVKSKTVKTKKNRQDVQNESKTGNNVLGALFGKGKKSRKNSKEPVAEKELKNTSSGVSVADTNILLKKMDARTKEVSGEIELEPESDSVYIRLLDNGEVDGDTVSVFLNRRLIVSNQRLSSLPIRISLPIDSLEEYVELIMLAENLGTTPPNTAFLIAESAGKTYELRLTSTLEKSATVRIKRKRKGGLKIR
jgi:hypothetical protein